MQVRVDYSDGTYRLPSRCGKRVTLPWWVVAVWRLTDAIRNRLTTHYIVPADNAGEW